MIPECIRREISVMDGEYFNVLHEISFEMQFMLLSGSRKINSE